MLSQLLWLGCKVECTVGLSEGLVCVEGERDGRLNDNWVGTTKEGVAVSVCVCTGREEGERGREREKEREGGEGEEYTSISVCVHATMQYI